MQDYNYTCTCFVYDIVLLNCIIGRDFNVAETLSTMNMEVVLPHGFLNIIDIAMKITKEDRK